VPPWLPTENKSSQQKLSQTKSFDERIRYEIVIIDFFEYGPVSDHFPSDEGQKEIATILVELG